MEKQFNWQRLIIGVAAVILLAIGCGLYFFDSAQANGATGIMVRVGMMLGVIWLALPQLRSMQTRMSTAVFLIALILLIVAAGRPNLFRVAAGIVAVALAANWILKWISKLVSR